MNKLSPRMQERLEKWRKSIQKEIESPIPKLRQEKMIRRGSKGDRGDALTLEELEHEYKLSQNRR
jgi:hypothetical protein